MLIKSLPTKDRHYLYCRDEGTNLLEITQFARVAAGAETLMFGYQILGYLATESLSPCLFIFWIVVKMYTAISLHNVFLLL